jgi:outer membrane murein-binding lipoprotein Lpp
MTEEKKAKGHDGVSRREFIKDAGLLVGGAAIGSTVLLAACGGESETKTETVTTTVTEPASTTDQTQTELTVLEPTGKFAQKITHLYAPRLDTLDGKKIALMD